MIRYCAHGLKLADQISSIGMNGRKRMSRDPVKVKYPGTQPMSREFEVFNLLHSNPESSEGHGLLICRTSRIESGLDVTKVVSSLRLIMILTSLMNVRNAVHAEGSIVCIDPE